MPKAEEGENDASVNASLGVASLFSVSGKVVLVTGGGSGIGAMIAAGFVQNGCRVYVASRKDTSAYAAQLTTKGPGSCVSVVCDVTDAARQQTLIETIEKAEGKLHVLVNNSGTNFNAPLEDYTMDAFRKVMQLNVDAMFGLTRICAPLLEKSSSKADPGRVINISSINGKEVPTFNSFAYSTSKAAVLMLTKHLASAIGERHITVNAICPGPFMSRMMRGTVQAAGEETVAGGTALGRLGTPEDAVGLCLMLSSRAGSYLTGAEIALDGGSLVARSRF
jgi:NAD(P)-dependent dehydrogenase (short-subunit alcohol dehydrogenase family)